ncbi:plasmalemma vesicle-associated protein [Nothobranchius furzeri]|uniref:Plasmalemma vesicle associated protein a n=2 Tax=Nothobranchius TaxID=28779 RepID=A0A1A8UC84_NOTFU|nr:plasmalemma vesicle associated protein a [Nothobranchius furzeri]
MISPPSPTMYSSSYGQVNKLGPEAQKKMQYHSKGKSCGYYMRIVFFFSSLIQSLIIVSLVLFLVYGKTQDSATRVQDLEERFSRLSIENVDLRKQRANLTSLLNITLTSKARNDWDLARLRGKSNISILIIQNCERATQQLNMEVTSCRIKLSQCSTVASPRSVCNCGLLHEQMKTRLDLVESNFTQTTRRMTMEREQILKEKESLVLEGIRLRRDKSTLEKETDVLKQMLKDKFSQFLGSVSGVSKALLEKIESFPQYYSFQVSCPKQREHLEQIHSNCTSLSREVEDKLQLYLNSIRDQVSNMQAEDSRLKAENWRLSEDYRWCNQNRSSIVERNKRRGEEIQQKHDQDKERLLMDKMKLNGEIDVLRNSVRYKGAEVDHLKEQLNQLNSSCMMKTGLGVLGARPVSPNQNVWNPLGAGGSSSSTGVGVGSAGLGGPGSSLSVGSAFNKLTSHGAGSSGSPPQSSGSSSSPSNTGFGFDKPASAGGGLPSSSFTSSGSSSSLSNTGSGYSKPGSAGGASSSVGSSGSSGLNKPAEREWSSTNIGSAGSSPSVGSSETSSNKPTSGVRSSSAFSFGSAGSSGSAGKSGSASSGFPWFGLGSSNSGQSKTGSIPGRTSTGTGSGGTGSSIGGGRTNGLTGGPGSVSQHIQELQRLINPPGPQDKQDLSRMLG